MTETGTPATPVPAATVVLVRDTAAGIECWMMRRVRAMAFASGATVFPGGRVDPADADPAVRWCGITPETAAARLGTDVPAARAVITAALRELFEETGVLLADPGPDTDLAAARVAVEQRRLSLTELLGDGGALAAGALHPWARWVTPTSEERRYDTWFFVAVSPHGAEPAPISSEADVAGWVAATDVLAAYESGEMLVLPPTVTMLRGLADAGSVAEVLRRAGDRDLAPVRSQLRVNAEGERELLAAGVVFAARRHGHP